MHRAALTDQTRKRLPITLIKARLSIGFHLFLRIYRNSLPSRVILSFEKAPTSNTRKPQIIGCIITHNSEAQINASERDRATRESQKLKKQQTVTPTIKGNAIAEYEVLHIAPRPYPNTALLRFAQSQKRHNYPPS